MPDSRGDPQPTADLEAGADPEPDSSGAMAPESAEPVAGPTPAADRRSFLRQLSTDAVWTAGRLAGASAALRRSLVAAGESAIGNLETLDGPDSPADEPDSRADEPIEEGAPASPAAQRQPAPKPPVPVVAASVAPASTPAPASSPAPDPIAGLTPQQHAFLAAGRRATLAVNDPGGHPLLASSIYHWDGALIRLPARDFTARTIDVDRDPSVSVLIDDPASDAWVAVTGIASLVYGDRVEPELRLILGKYHDEDDVARVWDGMRSTGDQLVILVRPTRFVWRS